MTPLKTSTKGVRNLPYNAHRHNCANLRIDFLHTESKTEIVFAREAVANIQRKPTKTVTRYIYRLNERNELPIMYSTRYFTNVRVVEF